VSLHLQEEPVSVLPEYAKVPVAFWVSSQLRVEPLQNGLAGWRLAEEPVSPPYLKDSDAMEGESPARWAQRWDIRSWGVFSAYNGTERLGGAIIAPWTPGIHLLEGRDDVALLSDIRVHPDYRRRGVGSRLFSAATSWAKERGYLALEIETQNTNVAACRFYARNGCKLQAVHFHAYSAFPDEAQLIWRLDL
jgi:GNAT superfamily N-acetyltransferase